MRVRTQARWREHNPDYAIGWRIQKRQETKPEADPPRMPRPLDRLPWDLAKDEFGGQGAEFIGNLGRVLLRVVKDEIGPQQAGNTRELGGVLGGG